MDRITESLADTCNVAAHLLEGNLEQGLGEKIAIYHQDQTYTYTELVNFVKCVAGWLSSLGIEPEDRIAILLPDSPELVFCFWGALWSGVVPVPINTAATHRDIHYILKDSRAKLLLTTQAWASELGKSELGKSESPFLQHVVITDDSASFLSQLKAQLAQPPYQYGHRDEPAFWLYTSGSTGRPKGVVHRQCSMLTCAEHYSQAVLGMGPDDVTYSVANIPFAYGLGNTLYMPVAVGAATVLSSAQNAFDIVADIHRYQPTIFFGIPSIYSALLAVEEISPLDTSSLRLCVSAAEQLPKTIWQRWKSQHELEICEGIGTTELLHIFLSNRPGNCRPGSSGKPVPGYSVQVLDAEHRPIAPGDIGELQVCGESLMLGYWNRLKETRAALHGETMRTGDKYLIDEEGFFWFMGRKDDCFKINGQWISPFEIEDIFLEHESILDIAIVPDHKQGENLTELVAHLTLKPGIQDPDDVKSGLRQWARSHLPSLKVPKAIHIQEELPRTSTGKIHRKALANQR